MYIEKEGDHANVRTVLVCVRDLLRHWLHALDSPPGEAGQEVGRGILHLARRTLDVEVLGMKHQAPQQNNSG